MPTNKPSSRDPNIPSRRRHLRIETPGEVWVYWKCAGLEDTSRVRDLCLGGLFIETKEVRDVGKEASFTFLFRKDKSGPKPSSAIYSPVQDWD